MEFEITKTIPGSLGRAGVIKTAHGEIKTPAFMAVGTHGYVRFLPPSDLHALGAQAMLSNGFHLRRESFEIAKAGGLASWRPKCPKKPCQAMGGPTLSEDANNQADAGLDATRRERPESITASEDSVGPPIAWQGPTLTDSGGFQVMSLGSGLGKVVSMEKERRHQHRSQRAPRPRHRKRRQFHRPL